jgi:L-aminoadipate-semialdehyde dehydrogenase
MNCIGFCATGKPKRIAFVSSTSTLDNEHYLELSKTDKGVLETDDLEGSRKGLGTGYGQSKWASEYIVREAGRRGLVGAIIRPGYIVGDPESGISVTDDFLVRLWKGCLQVGARPDIDNPLNAVPVTQVSRIVVASAFHLPTATGQSLGVAQVTPHPRFTLNQWIGALEVYGFKAPITPYQDWSAKVTEYVNDGTKTEEHALLPLFHLVTGNLPADAVARKLDDSNAAASLKLYEATEDPLAGSVMKVETIGMYLAYLVATGFLPAPTEKGEKELPKLDVARIQALTSGQLGGRSAAR